MPLKTVTFSVYFGIAGLEPGTGSGALQYSIVLDNNTVAMAPTNTGVTKSPNNAKLYQVTRNDIDTSWAGEIRWTDGAGHEARERLPDSNGSSSGMTVGQEAKLDLALKLLQS